MEKKNMILLTVIAVSTLLVAVVGATFAYFTATSTAAGNTNKTTVTTAEIASTGYTFVTEENDGTLVYPGYMAVSTYKLVASGDAASTATYDLKLKMTVPTEFGTDVSYAIYTEDAATASGVFKKGSPQIDTATNGEAHYFITGSSFDKKTMTELVAETAVTGAADEQVFNIATDTTIKGGVTRFYKVVLKYKNDEAAAQAAQGKSIFANLEYTAKQNK